MATTAALFAAWRWYDYASAGYLAVSGVAMFGMQATQPEAAPWSKFAIGYAFKTPCPARVGMLVKYIGAFGFSLGHSVLHGPSTMSVLMVSHFAKRILEVLMLHSFDGEARHDPLLATRSGTRG